MTTVDDLAAWLTQIWDEREKAARDEVEVCAYIAADDPKLSVRYDWVRVTSRGGTAVSSRFASGAPSPTEVLARIAADRQILALHAVVVSDANHAPLGPTCSTCGAWEEYPEDWPCQTVKLLALPHADRPGYQEAWRPE